jgi:hypothetical protein
VFKETPVDQKNRAQAGVSKDGFNPVVLILAIDPSCWKGYSFPKSINDKAGIDRFVDKARLENSGYDFVFDKLNAYAIQNQLVLI